MTLLCIVGLVAMVGVATLLCWVCYPDMFDKTPVWPGGRESDDDTRPAMIDREKA